MAQKGKIRELQEDLKIQKQAAKALGEYCTKFKKEIKDLEEQVKILTIQNVSKQRELLIAYAEWSYKQNDVWMSTEDDNVIVDKFLSDL